MMATDTLSLSQETLRQWQASHDYTSGLSPVERQMAEPMTDSDLPVSSDTGSGGGIFGDLFSGLGHLPAVVWWIILALILALAAYWALRHVDWHKQRKKERKGEAADEEAVSEDIYEVDDYVRSIGEAVANGDWAEAVRLVYLATLRHLDETGRIRWERYKTPMEYVDEADAPSLRSLTLIYLAVRFGHYPAGKALYEESVRLREAIEKGGVHA